MLLIISILLALTFHESLPLKCYKCDETYAGYWVDDKTLPPFPTACSLVEVKQQYTSSICWLSYPHSKFTYIDYLGDLNSEILLKNSSFSFVFLDIERELQMGSTRGLIYSCSTDRCNDQTNLQRVLSSLTLEENFAPLDVLFSNDTAKFTDQNSCINFSNALHQLLLYLRVHIVCFCK